MIDHVSFGCSDLPDAVALYTKLLAPLGFGPTQDYGHMTSFGRDGSQIFWLYQQKPDVSIVGAGSHIAFTAADTDQVDRFFEVVQTEGLTVVRPAGRRPDISESYYGIVARDRDGNMIEAVAWT